MAAEGRLRSGGIGGLSPGFGGGKDGVLDVGDVRRRVRDWGIFNVQDMYSARCPSWSGLSQFLERSSLELTGIQADLGVPLPKPHRAVFVHELVDTQLSVPKHRGWDASEIGEFLICLLNLARPSPDAGGCVYGCEMSACVLSSQCG